MKEAKRQRQAYELWLKGLKPKAIAEIMGISKAGATSMTAKGRKKFGAAAAPLPIPAVITPLLDRISTLEQENAQLRRATSGMYAPSAKDDTDWPEWDVEYKRLMDLDRMVVVHNISDMHAPDHDDQCIAMDLEINAAVQPDITIFNGDMFDFDVLSLKFARAYNRRRVDPFLEVEDWWYNLTRTVKRNNPKGIIIATGCNHGQGRLEVYTNEWEQIFGDRIVAAYNKLVRSEGRVLWLGWVQELYMQNTVFEHGLKAGANPAMGNFKLHGESFNDIAGHAHRWQQIVAIKQLWLQEQQRMLYYPLISTVTGCSQHVPPHYIKNTKAANSTQGSAVSYVNMHGLDTHIQNILYHPRVDGSMVAVFGTQVFEQLAISTEAQLRKTS